MPPTGGPRIFRWLVHFWTIYELLASIVITVAIVPYNTYFYGEMKPGFPVCGYEFSESVTKSNEASYFIKGDKCLGQEK
jgi:hypothetical protein